MGIACGLAVLLLISVAINILVMIYCVYRQREKFTSGGGARKSNVNPLYQPGGGRSNVELHYEIVQSPAAGPNTTTVNLIVGKSYSKMVHV